MMAQEATTRDELHLAELELAHIEQQIGTGSARDGSGLWSAAHASRLNALRYRQATCRARVSVLKKAAA